MKQLVFRPCLPVGDPLAAVPNAPRIIETQAPKSKAVNLEPAHQGQCPLLVEAAAAANDRAVDHLP